MSEDVNKEKSVQGTETPKEEIKKPTTPITPEPSKVPKATKDITPPKPEPKDESGVDPNDFDDMLKVGYIKEGDKISFTPKGGKETIVVVDKAFLKLPVREKEFYEEFNYKVVK